VIRRSCVIQGRIPKTGVMTRTLAIVLLSIGLSVPAPAADRACLSKAEQRAAISNGQAVTLAAAIKSVRASVRGRGAREVVRARLCREGESLLYVLTVLARDGKVTHTTVDASSGKVVEAR
jgi:uncharacterized membrane protein YkoI